eukprot:6487272-Amphidinium_carterae.1
MRRMGHQTADYDVINGDHQDLANDLVWAKVAQELETAGSALLGPPCSTFSRARGRGNGPRILRDAIGPSRYGRPNLTPAERESVRLGTLLAHRAADAIQILHRRGRPFILEQPWWFDGC